MAGSNNSLAISRRTSPTTWTDTVKKQGPKVLMGTISLAILIIGLLACLVAMGKLDQYSIGKLSNIPLAGSATMMGVGFLWLGVLCVYHFRKKEENAPAKKTGATSHPVPARPQGTGATSGAISRLRAEVRTKTGILLPPLCAENLMAWHLHVADLHPDNLVQFKTFIRQQLQKCPHTCYYFEDAPAKLYSSDENGVVSSVPLTDSLKRDIENGNSLPIISLLEHESTQSYPPCLLPPLEKRTFRKWLENESQLNDQQVGVLRRFTLATLQKSPNAIFWIINGDRTVIYQSDAQKMVTREKVATGELQQRVSELCKSKEALIYIIDPLPRLIARNFGIWHQKLSTMDLTQLARFRVYVQHQITLHPETFYCLREPRREANAATYYYINDAGQLHEHSDFSTPQDLQEFIQHSNRKVALETLLAQEAVLPELNLDTLWIWHACGFSLTEEQRQQFILFIQDLLLQNPQTYFSSRAFRAIYTVEKNEETQKDEVRVVDSSTDPQLLQGKEHLFDFLAAKKMPLLNEDTFAIWYFMAANGKLKPEQQATFEEYLPLIFKLYPTAFVTFKVAETVTCYRLNEQNIYKQSFEESQNAEINAYIKGCIQLHFLF